MKLVFSASRKPKRDRTVLAEKDLATATLGELHWYESYKAVGFTVVGELPDNPGCKYDFEIYVTPRDAMAILNQALRRRGAV